MQQANQMFLREGVKEEMVMINPARRNCFISEEVVIRSSYSAPSPSALSGIVEGV